LKCPFIGSEEDLTTLFAYPSGWTYRSRSMPIHGAKLEYKQPFCLEIAEMYHSCPLITGRQHTPFQEELRKSSDEKVYCEAQTK
jgi:hypothetical protein